jgi:hypothetical protein
MAFPDFLTEHIMAKGNELKQLYNAFKIGLFMQDKYGLH